MDDVRQRRSPQLRLLISPGLSERLACRSRDEWSSSEAGARGLPAETVAFLAQSASSAASMHKTLAHNGVLFLDDDRWWPCCDTRATDARRSGAELSRDAFVVGRVAVRGPGAR